MTEDSKSIGKLGGFFTSDGVLKSKKDLAAEERRAKKSAAEDKSQAAVNNIKQNGDYSRLAAKEVSNKTLKDVNKALNQIAESAVDIDAAKKAVKTEIQNLKALKEKMAAGSSEEIEALKKKQADAEKVTADIAKEIEDNNRERTLEGQTAIRVGHETLASFKPQKVQFSVGEKADLSSEESIKASIEKREAELEKLKAQSDAAVTQREKISDTAQKAVGKIREALGSSGIKNEAEAAKVAEEIAAAVKSAGPSSIEVFNPKNINQQVVASLSG